MKPDADEFKEFLIELGRKDWLGKPRRIWLKYSFHFTDILNAANILRDGKITSRARLERSGSRFVDIASPEVIDGTDLHIKEYVRLYFRPRTPTQFRMEGIRPKSEIWKNCHCPVPVFFLFDSLSILTRDDSKFSEVNLAMFGRTPSLVSTAAELREFDFEKIFHVGRFSQDSKGDIISRRNAEIVVPDELELSSLKFIYCRTPAEKETLIHLLTDKVRALWSPKIVVATSADLFIRDRAFVETVDLHSKGINIDFSPEANPAGPFDLKVIHNGENRRVHSKNNFYARGRYPLSFREESMSYGVEVYLEDHLAFAGAFDSTDDIPF